MELSPLNIIDYSLQKWFYREKNYWMTLHVIIWFDHQTLYNLKNVDNSANPKHSSHMSSILDDVPSA